MVKGAANCIIDQVCQERAQTGGIQDHQKELAEGSDRLKAIVDCKKISLGVLVANGIHSLSQDISTLVNAKITTEQNKIDTAACKRKEEKMKCYSAVQAIQTVKGSEHTTNFEKWTKMELESYFHIQEIVGQSSSIKVYCRSEMSLY